MEALGRLNAAAAVLARYQAPLQEATAAKETAQALADDAVMNVQAAEEARDAAVWGHEHPGLHPADRRYRQHPGSAAHPVLPRPRP